MWDEMDPRKQHGIIRHYHITIRLATGSSLQHAKTVPGSHRSFVEEGLKPFTMYSISVAATTNGTGPYSDPIEARTKQASPSKVLNVTLERITSKSVELAWREPSEPRGVIKHYEVGYRSSSMSDYVLYQTRDSNTSFTIEQLIPYTSYDIIVLAVNSHRGFPSDVITGQTKEDLPGPPHSVSFSHSNKQRTAHVSWEEPEIKNGIIKEYTLTYRALKPTVKGYKYKDERVVEAGNREYEFNDMQPNMQYNFTVWAHTSVGHGIKKSTIGQIMASEPEKTPTPRLINDTLLPRDQKKLALSRADETFGTIQYYRLGVFYAPLSRPSSRQQREDDSWKNYIAAHFGPDRVPAIYTVGDNSTYLNNLFRNRPLEMGYKYHFVFYAHVDEGIIGESEPTETFELVLPTAKPEDESGSGGFPVAIIIVVVLVVLAVIIALIIFIFLWMKLHQRETVKDKVPPIDEVDLGEADTDDSIEYLRRQARSTMEKYPPVRISDFEMHVKRLQANANLKFSQEYESIRLDMDFTSVASNLAVNDEKNRYSNIVAYDHTRVRLSAVKGQQGSDYINANYIDGHKKKNAYIATQGPLKETAGDFWQMVWEQRSSTIVMLTNLEERGRPKCYRYWPDMGSAVFDTMEITQKDVITLADYVVRTFAVAKTEHPDEVREVKQLQFMSWPDHGVPTYATAMLAFQRKVRAANPPNSGPVIVHCSAGVGRTGAFIVIDAMLDRIQELDTIDVYGHVSVLRSQRNYMVQTEDQYFFIHEAVLEAIQCGDTEINAKDLPTAMQRLNEVVSDDGSIAIELEFKRLAMDKLDPNRFSTANRSVNKNKNRFVNILPFENTRVVLSYTRGVDGSDYINASLVDGYKQRNAFIATQGPLKETEQEFWRMLWEQESKVIVMLTKLTERGQEKCHQYWPEGKAARYGSFLVVEPLSEQRKADCILRQFKMTNAHDGSSRTLCQYQYVGWPENRSPVSGRALIDLIGEVQKLQDKTHDAGPVTVHCSAGVGRTGCFIALSVVLERMRCEGVLDIFQTVKMLRIQRPAMVQTLDQYQFVYDTALEYLDSFDHYADYAPLDVQEDEQEVD
jgi:netrin-G3 ligand